MLIRPANPFGFTLTPENAVFISLGAGLASALTVYLFFRFVLGWGRPSKIDEDVPIRLEPRRDVASEDDPFVHGSKMDRRQALRRGGNPVQVLISDADAKAEPINGYVLDRSTGGLCLSVGEPIEEGTILTVRTTNAPVTTPWVKIEVRNCRPISSSEWEIGCKFDKTPPWSVLLLFG